MFIHRNNCSFTTLHLWLSDFLGFYFVTVKNWHGGCLSPPFVRRLARVMHCVMRGVHVCKLDIHEFGSKLWWETYLVSQCLFQLFLYLDKFLVYFLKNLLCFIILFFFSFFISWAMPHMSPYFLFAPALLGPQPFFLLCSLKISAID